MTKRSDFLVPGGALDSPLLAALLGPHVNVRTLAPGDRIGPYRIVSELGRGGMSIVYLAERADGAWEQQVALKLLRPEFDPARAREVLQRERQVLARLDHPGVARLIDGGGTEDGLLWFAMERVMGERIDHYAARLGLPLPQRLALFLDVCDAVQYAHARLLIHRDIKPSNILVGADARPRLLDFGIAGLLDDGSAVLGTHGMTPNIASPEQRRGEVETTATDVFQLGLLLRVLLHESTGMASSHATQESASESSSRASTESGFAQRLASTLGEATGENHPGLDTPARASRPGRAGDLDAIVNKATASNPEARHASVAALADDVRAWLACRPVSAVPLRALYRLRCFVRRNRAALAVAMSVALAFATMAGAFVWRIQHARAVAESERESARREATKAASVTRFLVDTFREASPLEQNGRHLSIDEMLTDAPRRIDAAFGDQPAIRAELFSRIGIIQYELGNYATALPLLREAATRGHDDPELPEYERAWRDAMFGIVLASTSEFQQAEELLESAVQQLERIAPGSVQQQLAQRVLAVYHARRGEPATALAILRELVPKMDANPDMPRSRVIQAWGDLAGTQFATGDEHTFPQTARTACDLARAELGQANPVTINNCTNALIALVYQKRYAEAEREGLEILRVTQTLDQQHVNPRALNIHRQLTFLALEQAHWDEAAERARTALAITQALPAEDDHFSTDLLGYLALATFEQHRYRQSLEHATRALEQNRNGLRISAPDDGVLATYAARALAALGRCEEAQHHATLARETFELSLARGNVAADVFPTLERYLGHAARLCPQTIME